VEIVQHVPDETLERFAMQAIPDSESERLEEHILICRSGRARLQAEPDFVTAMRGAAAKVREAQES
jgi:hypothetical protein